VCSGLRDHDAPRRFAERSRAFCGTGSRRASSAKSTCGTGWCNSCKADSSAARTKGRASAGEFEPSLDDYVRRAAKRCSRWFERRSPCSALRSGCAAKWPCSECNSTSGLAGQAVRRWPACRRTRRGTCLGAVSKSIAKAQCPRSVRKTVAQLAVDVQSPCRMRWRIQGSQALAPFWFARRDHG
jgi:hypothetical protein